MSKYSYGLILLLLSTIGCKAQSFNYQKDYNTLLMHTQTKGDSIDYKSLLPKFLNNDPKLTVYQTLALMIGYTGLPDYKPFEDIKIERLLLQLNDSAKYEQVLTMCDTFLITHPLNQTAIIEKAYAFYKLKKNDSAAFYKEQFGRLMAAMDWSNNGRSPNTAMFAIGPKDGQNFVDKYYHADVGNTGNTTDKDGNYCSSVEMKYKKEGKDKSVVFYFVLQHAANSTAKKNNVQVNKKP
jgi:hypothetical protein